MAFLYSDLTEVSPYLKARKKFYTPEAWTKMINALKTSTTLYIGNLSFYTDEEQVYTLFSLCGPVRRVIMGIHKYTHLPCGFCFVEYYFHRDAMASRDYLNGTKLDDRIIRVDLDPGFEPGRQFGRGATGGQVRDDRRHDFDEGRGGLPPRHKQRIEKHAIAQGQLVGPTNGPINNDNHHHLRHRYEQNMTVNDGQDPKENKDNKYTKNKDDKDKEKDIKDNDNKEAKTESSANNSNKDNSDNKESKEENDNDKKTEIPSTNGDTEKTKMELDSNNDTNHTQIQQNGEHDKDKDKETNNGTNGAKNENENEDIDMKQDKDAPPSENANKDDPNPPSTTTTITKSDDIQEPPLKKQKVDT